MRHMGEDRAWGILGFVGLLAGASMLAGCGGEPPDGYRSVGTGDLYGEWELLAEWEDGEWTGCLRFEPPGIEQCGDPDAQLVTYDGVDVVFGAVAEGESLERAGGGEVALLDGRFFVLGEAPHVRPGS